MITHLVQAWDIASWNAVIEQCAPYDIYHRAEYHLLACETGTPYLLLLQHMGTCLALPFVVQGSSATSVYGYPGPIFNESLEPQNSLRHDLADRFQDLLEHTFADLGVLEFETRLHPLLHTEWILQPMCKIAEVGRTVAVDLSLPRGHQRAQVSKGHQADITKLSHRIVVEYDYKWAHLDTFLGAYQETMDRADAKAGYYFPDRYFNSLKGFIPNNVMLVHAWHGDEIVSSAFFFLQGQFAQYHLSATRTEHLKWQGAKMILNYMIPKARELGYRWLHLGGGVGGDEDDPLWTFKKGWSKVRQPFKVARWEA